MNHFPFICCAVRVSSNTSASGTSLSSRFSRPKMPQPMLRYEMLFLAPLLVATSRNVMQMDTEIRSRNLLWVGYILSVALTQFIDRTASTYLSRISRHRIWFAMANTTWAELTHSSMLFRRQSSETLPPDWQPVQGK